MPLSEHEQRVLEQIERSLYAEDPKFRAAVKKTSSKRARTGSIRLAVVCGLIGLTVLIGGAWLQNVFVGVLGFLIMLAGGIMGIRATQNPAPKQGGKRSDKKAAGAAKGAGGSSAGVADKAQERMRRRFEGGQ